MLTLSIKIVTDKERHNIDLDKSGDLDMEATAATVSIEMLGEGVYAPGSSIGRFMPIRFVVNGRAERTGSRAKAHHRRGIELLVPGE